MNSSNQDVTLVLCHTCSLSYLPFSHCRIGPLFLVTPALTPLSHLFFVLPSFSLCHSCPFSLVTPALCPSSHLSLPSVTPILCLTCHLSFVTPALSHPPSITPALCPRLVDCYLPEALGTDRQSFGAIYRILPVLSYVFVSDCLLYMSISRTVCIFLVPVFLLVRSPFRPSGHTSLLQDSFLLVCLPL